MQIHNWCLSFRFCTPHTKLTIIHIISVFPERIICLRRGSSRRDKSLRLICKYTADVSWRKFLWQVGTNRRQIDHVYPTLRMKYANTQLMSLVAISPKGGNFRWQKGHVYCTLRMKYPNTRLMSRCFDFSERNCQWQTGHVYRTLRMNYANMQVMSFRFLLKVGGIVSDRQTTFIACYVSIESRSLLILRNGIKFEESARYWHEGLYNPFLRVWIFPMCCLQTVFAPISTSLLSLVISLVMFVLWLKVSSTSTINLCCLLTR